MGRTVFAAGEREESDAECVCGKSGRMRSEAGGDDSGDESGVGTDVITQNFIRSKQRKTAVHQNDGSPFFPSMVRYVVRRICKNFAQFKYDTEVCLPNTIN